MDEREWATTLKREWEARARSKHRDFFVASHDGWDDTERWAAQAEIDAKTLLFGFPDERVARMSVLEVGCGVGRVAAALAGKVGRYTGFDISRAMVEEARTRVTAPNVTFEESDGISMPGAAIASRYDLVFALAVFIHCPRPVVLATLQDAWPLVAPGGHLRAQVLIEPTDAYPILVPADAAQLEADMVESVQLADRITDADADVLKQIAETSYKGHEFAFDDLRTVVESLPTLATATFYRFDRFNLYFDLERAP